MNCTVICEARPHSHKTCHRLPGSGNRFYLRAAITGLFLAIVFFPRLPYAAELVCPQGEAVLADLGDGVIMRTCMWEKTANVRIRTGPLELIKNGVLILKLETDVMGRLHGPFTSWNDAGEATENGNYVEGLKEGPWTVTDKNGITDILHYRAGVIVKH